MRQFGLVVLLYAALPFSVLRTNAEDGPITPGEAIRLFSGKDLSNVPALTVTAPKDRDGEDIYDPNGTPHEFRGGRINWFGRDPDWKDELGFRGKQDVESADGQWTRVEVICDGDKITNIVNGKVVNVARGPA